jgi:hypothetical protein
MAKAVRSASTAFSGPTEKTVTVPPGIGTNLKGLFNGQLIVRIHHPVDSIGLDGGSIVGDLQQRFGGWNLFKQYGNFHDSPSFELPGQGW